MPNWTEDISQLVDRIRLLSLQGDTGPVKAVLTEAEGFLNATNYDNWNGGTTHYTLELQVPARTYVEIESGIEDLESQILARVKKIHRGETNDFIDTVLIQPRTDGTRPPTEAKFWLPGYFRIFISHIGKNKANAGRLKSALERYGISSFVAHDDIEPTKEWQREIEDGLFSMDGLIAILAPGFNASNWTNHECGVAIGREVIVVPIMFGKNPHGLIGKLQGIKAKDRSLSDVSKDVFVSIMNNPLSSGKLVSCLVEQFLVAGTVENALTKLMLLHLASVIPNNHLSSIRECIQNSHAFVSNETLVTVGDELLQKHDGQSIDRSALDRKDSVSADDIPF